jgi:pyridoxamine 5'-phosphate oxidase
MEGRFELEKRIAQFAIKYGLVKTPRPPNWKGWCIVPNRIEFWRDRPFRLHDRLEFIRAQRNTPWMTQRLYP